MSKSNGAADPAENGRDIEAELEALAAKMDRLQRELAGEPDPEEQARQEYERKVKLQQDRDRRDQERGERAVEFYDNDLGPRHRAVVKRIGAALLTLEAAIVAEEGMHQELRDFGYGRPGAFHMMPFLGFPSCGRLSNPHSGISKWFQWAALKGYQVDDQVDVEPEPEPAVLVSPEPEPAKPIRRSALSAFARRRANGKAEGAANG